MNKKDLIINLINSQQTSYQMDSNRVMYKVLNISDDIIKLINNVVFGYDINFNRIKNKIVKN